MADHRSSARADVGVLRTVVATQIAYIATLPGRRHALPNCHTDDASNHPQECRAEYRRNRAPCRCCRMCSMAPHMSRCCQAGSVRSACAYRLHAVPALGIARPFLERVGDARPSERQTTGDRAPTPGAAPCQHKQIGLRTPAPRSTMGRSRADGHGALRARPRFSGIA